MIFLCRSNFDYNTDVDKWRYISFGIKGCITSLCYISYTTVQQFYFGKPVTVYKDGWRVSTSYQRNILISWIWVLLSCALTSFQANLHSSYHAVEPQCHDHTNTYTWSISSQLSIIWSMSNLHGGGMVYVLNCNSHQGEIHLYLYTVVILTITYNI